MDYGRLVRDRLGRQCVELRRLGIGLTPGRSGGLKRSPVVWHVIVATAASSVTRIVSGPRRVWVLSATLAALAAIAYIVAIQPLAAIVAPIEVSWELIAVLFAAAEVLVVHLQFRRDTHSFSLSEIPLVMGLFFLRPTMLLVALLVGSGVALALHRRQPAVKLAFNLANLALTTAIAIIVFRTVLQAADPLGPSGWLAAFLAAITADLMSLLMITAAIALATNRRPSIGILGSGSVATFFNTCLAIVAVTVLWVRPEAAWLPFVLAGLMVAAYRIYGSVRQKHESLELLYESTRRLQESPEVGPVVAALLAQAREMFRAEHSEILLFPAEGGAGFEATLRSSEKVETVAIKTLDATTGVWARVASEGRGVSFARPIANGRLRDYFDARGVRDAMVAPLFGQDAVVGTIVVGNRLSEVTTFNADDLKLFETFANHASASLENARLIERLRRQAEQNHHQALHDDLTGLPNRAFFHRQVQDAIMANVNAPIAVLLMDLDRFKEVNDTLGHQNGDFLLQAVAVRLQSAVRPTDFVARLGGDEFGILIRDASDAASATFTAERLIHELGVPFAIQELTLEVGASVGISLYPDHGSDVDTLLQRADVALYEAKTTLRGRQLYSSASDPNSPDRLLLLGELRTAVDEHQLVVLYQPKVDLATGRIVGAEALVRWLHPRRGIVGPDDFIPVVEHTGLLRPLTLYVLDAALRECSTWRGHGFAVDVAVNLSVCNLLDLELPDDIGRLLARYGLPSSALELEITESALIADPARTHGVLDRIHDLGTQIAIDDFGTGYSSLSYLRRMPVNELKIDRSFVTAMAADENDALIVRSTIDLGRNLGLRVVAEGVETRDVAEQLASMGCHIGQGYYFGRPVSGEAFLMRLTAAGNAEGPGGMRPAARPRRSSRRRLQILRPIAS